MQNRKVSEFIFSNQTGRALWVDSVSGFRHDPACGVISADGEKEFVGTPQKVPDTIAITWWYGNRETQESKPVKSDIDFAAIPVAKRSGALKLRFTEEEKWVGEFVPIQ